MPEATNDIADSFESLLESAADYGKTSYDLVKLKAIEKVSDVASSLIPNTIVFLFFMSFLLFINLGLAYYLSEIFMNVFYGFLVIAAFYLVLGLIVHVFMHDRIKRKISDYIIQKSLE